jgi:hypothetical protein
MKRREFIASGLATGAVATGNAGYLGSVTASAMPTAPARKFKLKYAPALWDVQEPWRH